MQAAVFEAVCDGCELISKQKDWRRLMQLLLVCTTVLFDDNTHLLFSVRSPTQRVQTLLNRLGKCWRQVFSRKNEDLGLGQDSTIKDDLQKFLLGCQKDLQEGGYGVEYLNQFRNASFPFTPKPDGESDMEQSDDEQQNNQGHKRRAGGAQGGDGKKPKMDILNPLAQIQYADAGEALDLDSPGKTTFN